MAKMASEILAEADLIRQQWTFLKRQDTPALFWTPTDTPKETATLITYVLTFKACKLLSHIFYS